MSADLEARLRDARHLLPGPDEAATEAARASMRTAIGAAAPAPGGRRRLLRRARSRPFILATAILLALAGAALAAGRWSPADLPPFGDHPREAFVMPATDVLPGGYERTRPPRYADLPERPSLVFPAGFTHTEAVRRYAAARQAGELVPAGAELSDPLPAGKVALVVDGRVAIDPAAPLGWSPLTGLVKVLADWDGSEAEPLARCQLLIGRDDAGSPACEVPPGAERAYVREGVAGRWIPSPNQEQWEPGLVAATTELSVLERPVAPGDRITSPRVRDLLQIDRPGGPRPDLSQARRPVSRPGLDLYVVPSGEERVCLLVVQGARGAGTCAPLATLAQRGAITVNSGGLPSEPTFRLSGLVGDGFDTVTAPDGTTAPVHDNAFTVELAREIDRVRFSGPAGSFDYVLRIGDASPKMRPDRSRERALVRIPLANGGHASIRVAPNRGGGQCRWLYITGDLSSSGCPGDEPLPYDTVTLGLARGPGGDSLIYSGQLAPQVGALEMSFADGARVRLPIIEDSVLYEVPPGRLTLARRPVAVTTFDRQGVPLVRDELERIEQIIRRQRSRP